MSCGMVALERVGIQVQNYFASEIDKYAIQISKKNYSNIIQLGNILNWHDWGQKWEQRSLSEIDLLIGGSPCQGFSVAGKHLNFKDPRSALFFKYVEILKWYKPKKFLLENVGRMDRKVRDKISEILGVEPLRINSSLLSGQNRDRYYWTDIEGVEQPEDKGIVMKDILDTDLVYERGHGCTKAGVKQLKKMRPLMKQSANNIYPEAKCKIVGTADLNGHDILKRVYSTSGKSPTLTAVCGGNQEKKIAVDEKYWRKLTPLECERLQTLPDNYTEGVSNTQRYKMIGNGWTVDVIAHIFKGLL